MSNLMIPCVHLNGTDGTQLREGCRIAHEALRVAVEKLQEAAPNQRDYYVKGPDAFRRAATEHEARLVAIAKVQAELVEIFEGVQEQIDEIEKSRAMGRR